MALLDLSAAFDTIDHAILLSRLSTLYGISGTALKWFKSYLSDRSQTVTINSNSSKPAILHFGVPQGSVLGPVLFILYTKPLFSVIHRHSISGHSFADDTQVHDSCPQGQITSSIQTIQNCISDIKSWMTCNKLKLNDDKTEVMLLKSDRTKSNNLNDTFPNSMLIGTTNIPFSSQAKNLGYTISSNLSVENHVSNVCKIAYLQLRRIGSIRHLLPLDAAKTLVCSTVLSKLDYCNSLLFGAPKHIIDKLQKVQNSAARLVLKARKTDNAQPLLQALHWLPIKSRIDYKIAILCFNFFLGTCPAYLSDILKVYTPRRSLRSSADTRKLIISADIKTKTFGQRSFCYAAPSVWNSLPYEIRHSPSILSFKTQLKTHLFRVSFSQT